VWSNSCWDYDGKLWIGFIRLRMRISCRLWRSCLFCKRRGVFFVAAKQFFYRRAPSSRVNFVLCL
jgi:hypothetical protein